MQTSPALPPAHVKIDCQLSTSAHVAYESLELQQFHFYIRSFFFVISFVCVHKL